MVEGALRRIRRFRPVGARLTGFFVAFLQIRADLEISPRGLNLGVEFELPQSASGLATHKDWRPIWPVVTIGVIG